jgi:glycosyltransferase involved in cell wall biosynthesis
MPVAILEAWAANKPVVASRVGGVPELVVDKRTGLLFPPGADDALAECLHRLLGNPALAALLAQTGKALVRERYDTKVMAGTYLRHYQELIRPTARV